MAFADSCRTNCISHEFSARRELSPSRISIWRTLLGRDLEMNKRHQKLKSSGSCLVHNNATMQNKCVQKNISSHFLLEIKNILFIIFFIYNDHKKLQIVYFLFPEENDWKYYFGCSDLKPGLWCEARGQNRVINHSKSHTHNKRNCVPEQFLLLTLNLYVCMK